MPRRGEKVAARKALSLLGTGSLAPTTVRRYDAQQQRFDIFLSILAGTVTQEFVQAGALQALLVWGLLYLQLGYDTEFISLSEAGTWLSGLRHYLREQVLLVATPNFDFESVLKPLWGAYRKWARLEPYEFRQPVTELVLHAQVGVCILKRRFRIALWLLLSHHCLLRPGEARGMLWSDVWPSSETSVAGVVRISKPKMKSPPVQHVLIEDHRLVRLYLACRDLRGNHPADEPLFGLNEYTMHRAWTLLLKAVGLPAAHNLCAAGLRAGGATCDYLVHQSLDRLEWRGRWHSRKVLEHYIQLGVYAMTGTQWPPAIVHKMMRLRQVALSFLDALQ